MKRPLLVTIFVARRPPPAYSRDDYQGFKSATLQYAENGASDRSFRGSPRLSLVIWVIAERES